MCIRQIITVDSAGHAVTLGLLARSLFLFGPWFQAAGLGVKLSLKLPKMIEGQEWLDMCAFTKRGHSQELKDTCSIAKSAHKTGAMWGGVFSKFVPPRALSSPSA